MSNTNHERTNTERRTLTHSQWVDEGRELFGPDVDHWRFVCPACNTVMIVAVMRAVGFVGPEIGSMCLGRKHPAPFRYRGLGSTEVNPNGVGCDYTAYGLFDLCTVHVEIEGATLPAFAFDRGPA